MATKSTNDVTVGVVGGGIAGLTAALKLAKNGYKVSLFESRDVLGGNLCTQSGGVEHEQYPHMYCDWYENFFHMLEHDLGMTREKHFRPEAGAKFLRKNGDLIELKNPTGIRAAFENVFSGLLSPSDMFRYGYSLIDLAAQRLESDNLLSQFSLNGFMRSRPYSSEGSAELLDMVVLDIWSIHSEETSAAAYRNFSKHNFSFPHATPFAWALKGSVKTQLVDKLNEKLKSLGCQIHTGQLVNTIQLPTAADETPSSKVKITFDGKNKYSHLKPKALAPIECDHLVLATTPKSLTNLVEAPAESGRRRIVDVIPDLSQVRRLRSEAIPVTFVYFKHKLQNLPQEHVALVGTSGFTFYEISQLWESVDPSMKDRTVLIIAASDFYTLGQFDEPGAGFHMIKTLHEYLPVFNPGAKWGDKSEGVDIDYDKSNFKSSLRNKLYINSVGNESWVPQPAYPNLERVVFAGDFCLNDVSMATVEGAVLSGLNAANALWDQHPVGDKIKILPLPEKSNSEWLLMKLAFAPAAYWAKWWDLAQDAAGNATKGDVGGVVHKVGHMWRLPFLFAEQHVDTAYSLGSNLLRRVLKKPKSKTNLGRSPLEQQKRVRRL